MTTGQQLQPIFYIGEQIERDGLMVIDVTGQPLDGAPYISPYAVVALCEQGTAYSEYDMMRVEFHPHDLTIMHQGHIVSARSISPDYRARLIVMSEDFFEKLKHQNFQRFGQQSLYYEKNPHFHLNDEQYRYIKASFDLLEGVSKIGRRYKEELFLSIFSALMLLHYEFSPIPEEYSEDALRRLSLRFKDAVINNYRTSREVAFYANMFCLSPKYFSTLIKQETGFSAGDWIDRYVTLQAKQFLKAQPHLSIQQIAARLGFGEQASFSRFFKNNTGMTPSQYRESSWTGDEQNAL